MEIYLDNSATTRVFPEVAAYMTQIMCNDYGNPSSLHQKGLDAEQVLRKAKETLAGILKVNAKELLFTSGGTESDNLALRGVALAHQRRGRHLITTQIEHPAILQTMHFLEEQGFQVTYLPVDGSGRIRLEDLQRSMRMDTILVSIMHTNNEVGSRQPIAEAGALIKRLNPNTLFHVDAVQGFGKSRIYPKKMNIDLLSVSGHKIHGPKGSGFLYIRQGTKIKPIIYGGGQERGLRSGTENVYSQCGLGEAVSLMCDNMSDNVTKLRSLKEHFVSRVRNMEFASINGLTDESSAPNIVSVSIKDVRAEVVLHSLEEKGIYVSAGSACSSNKPAISRTLQAINVPKEMLDKTVRFSFSIYNTIEEVDYACDVLEDIVPKLMKYTRR